MEQPYKQIVIKYHSEVLEREAQEVLWAVELDSEKGLYQIDNIPYYGPALSCEDLIIATFNHELKQLEYQDVYKLSGNSTIQVMVQQDKYNRDDLYNEILMAQTEIEVVDDFYFVISVPAKTDYRNVYAILAELEQENVIAFAEPVLSPKHSADLRG